MSNVIITPKKSIATEIIASELGGKIWSKNGVTRIYIDRGFNTKKMSTSSYLEILGNSEIKVSVFIECPNQPFAWIKKQEEEVINNVVEDIERIIEDNGGAEVVLEVKNETKTETVQGYYMRWYEVKVPINSYGKLELRKRQKVHTFSGDKSNIPAGFVELTDERFTKAKEMEVANKLFNYGENPIFA